MAWNIQQGESPEATGRIRHLRCNPGPIIPACGRLHRRHPVHSRLGSVKQAVLVGSVAEFQSLYGYSQQTPGYIAVKPGVPW